MSQLKNSQITNRITWFKDQFGTVHLWFTEMVPHQNIVDTADCSLQEHVELFVPEAQSADLLDWGWSDVPFSIEFYGREVAAS